MSKHKNKSIAFAGAGISSSVIANRLARAGYQVTVYEKRNHIAGNCYTSRDEATNLMVHNYGPHIFHTNDKEVWDFVNELTEFKTFVNRVKTTSQGAVYSLPINLHTINQFFNNTFSPAEAEKYIESLADLDIKNPQNFEEQALRFVGKALYDAFFKGYTLKQWGIAPNKLPASILKRLPVRFNYDDNYFNHKYQGMPKNGYNVIVEKLLDHPNITVKLNNAFTRAKSSHFDHVFFSGPLDSYFDYELGRLAYRTLDFKKEIHDGDFQGVAVMNYADQEIPFTRITEHKHFSPWESHKKTIIYKEYSRSCGIEDEPYYPLKLVQEQALLKRYKRLANSLNGVTFIGRLGCYQYIDMDVAISQAMKTSSQFLMLEKKGNKIPSFFTFESKDE